MVSFRTYELFLGAWSLINNTRTDNGVQIYDTTYGDKPAGTIMYTSSGFMCAVLTATNATLRPQDLTLPAEDNQTDAEWAAVGRHTLAYSGPFYFNQSIKHNETNGQVVHGPLISSTLPSFVGSFQHRTFSFHDDYQTLELIGDLGNGVVDTLYWAKMNRDFLFSDVGQVYPA